MADAESAEENAVEEATGDGSSWLRWGQAILYVEMVIAVLITVFSLYLAFSGQTGFLG